MRGDRWPCVDCNTVREAGMSQYSHVQGEVNSITKLDRHFYGLFGFMTIKDSDIWIHSPNPETTFHIKRPSGGCMLIITSIQAFYQDLKLY